VIHCFEDILKNYGPLLSRVAGTDEAYDSIRQELYQEICVAVTSKVFERYKGKVANTETAQR
jgi:hypothetical protein